MLVKDTKGRVLTDVHGRPMTNKDRWHPLVTSFVKRVIADGGEIISPAIEEMNQMAWEGKFDDALFAYFAGARKVGKTYALIPNDGSGDLVVSRDSVAWEWEKYRTLDEIVNDMPEMAFDPAIREFQGVANRRQTTNLIENSDSPQVENIATTAQSYTISFYGTGSYILSGSHTATVNGTGGFERTILTFTPSAGTLTITPSGSVQYPQLVVGTYAGGIVVTNGSIATRLTDYIYNNTSVPMDNIVVNGEIEGENTSGGYIPFVRLFYDIQQKNISLGLNYDNGQWYFFARLQENIDVVGLIMTAPVENRSVYRFAFVVKQGEYALFLNGIEYQTFTVGNINTPNIHQGHTSDVIDFNQTANREGIYKCLNVFENNKPKQYWLDITSL